MSEELKCPSCGHGRVLHDLFRGCMQFNCSCTRNKEQVDTLLLISERNALRLQLESVNNENAYLHKQVEVIIQTLYSIRGVYPVVGEVENTFVELARLEEAKNG